ncbi:hypothetical protein CDD80_2246 [Ophiocordyceps camponoti-rufipedis]|uniref:Uncharacterized protein n=1 Tax=Ophiocordyceps camponoti-rufipedis TaxID=2004952 RepID=A0A2C5Z186_9HYPO|nr:hypothetical protein CDD80_2246 [Ophiocordyceps camponoti-rufipedis]
MTSVISIPAARPTAFPERPKPAGGSSASSYSSSSSPSSPSSTAGAAKTVHTRRPRLLSMAPIGGEVYKESWLTAVSATGSAISKQQCTVINIGDPDGPPRLISYLSSSQGFAWNPGRRTPHHAQLLLTRVYIEIFLPNHVDCDYEPLENQCEPVHEIVLSDEESTNLLPQ